jgi:hypothetical protein
MTLIDRTHARRIALDYVRKLLAKGYDTARAEEEIAMGYCGPGEAGWCIAHGKMTVPHCGPTEYTFPFAELEAEAIGPQQLDLFLLQ